MSDARHGKLTRSMVFYGNSRRTKLISTGTLIYATRYGSLWQVHPVDDPRVGRNFSARRPLTGIRWLSPLELLALQVDERV